MMGEAMAGPASCNSFVSAASNATFLTGPNDIPAAALREAMARADWPARLQRLSAGPMTNRLPPDANLWLDGGHNPSAAQAVSAFLRGAVPADRPLHIVCGLLANKDATGVIEALAWRATAFHAVPVPGHPSHDSKELAGLARARGLRAGAAASVADALDAITASGEPRPAVLIMGSLYLAGEVLRRNEQMPS